MRPEDYRLVKKLFERALSLSPEERSAMLDVECDHRDAAGADAQSLAGRELRSEVEALLARVEDDGGELDRLLVAEDGPSEGADRSATHDRAPPADAASALPEQIGPYRILRRCGHGGMGTVYEAEQDSPRRRVALKIMRHGLPARDSTRRFEREAEILGRLQHPDIAQVFEAGEFELGGAPYPYFAMEFIDGLPLVAFAEERELSVADRLELFARVCDAVHYAHQHGVIHRDLKPDNILVIEPVSVAVDSSFASPPQPKILDFGVARLTGSDLGSTMHTRVGQVVGSLSCMSPEQAAGDVERIDARSDVYALGVLLFELLAGCLPYELEQRSIAVALTTIREHEPTMLGTHDVSLRGDVETIAGKCLEKEPERRYPSAAALADDVRRYLGDQPITARPPTTWYQIRKFTRRNRTLVGGVVATVLVSVAGTIVATALALRASDNEARALAQEEEANRIAYRAALAAASALASTDPAAAGRQLLEAPPKLRGWEWQHLSGRLSPYLLEFPPALNGQHVLFDEGRRMLSMEADDIMVVHEVATGRLDRRVRLPGPAMWWAATSHEVPRVAVVLEDRQVLVGELGGPLEHWSLRGLDSPRELRINRQGSHIAVRSLDAVWIGCRGTWVRPLLPDKMTARGRIRFVPDGSQLMVMPDSTRLWWIDLQTGEVVDQHDQRDTHSIAMAPDGSFLVRGKFREIEVFEGRGRRLLARLHGHQDFVGGLLVAEDGERLVSVARDETVRRWNLASKRCELVLSEPGVLSMSALGDDYLLTSSERRTRLWRATDLPPAVSLGHGSYVYDVAWSGDGTTLVAREFGRGARVWDVVEGRQLWSFEADLDLRIQVVDPHGETTWNGRYRFDWLATEPVDDFAAWKVERSRDGRPRRQCVDRVVVPQRHFALRIGHYKNPTSMRAADLVTDRIQLERGGEYWGGDLHPDGRTVVAMHTSGRVDVWDLDSGRQIHSFAAHASQAYCAAFSPDGTRLATGGNDNTIRIWDVATWTPLLELHGHQSYVKAVVFSPDGTRLASASGDRTVRIWDSVAPAVRYREKLEVRAVRDAVRPQIEEWLRELGSPAAVVERIRAAWAEGDTRRHAALRVLAWL